MSDIAMTTFKSSFRSIDRVEVRIFGDTILLIENELVRLPQSPDEGFESSGFDSRPGHGVVVLTRDPGIFFLKEGT